MSEVDLEKQSAVADIRQTSPEQSDVKVQFQDTPRGRKAPHSSLNERRSRSLSRSRQRDPEVVLPALFRTVSYGVDEQIKERDSKKPSSETPYNSKAAQKAVDAFSEIEWHALTSEQVSEELNTDLDHGLNAAQVQENLAKYGANAHSPPPNRIFRKLLVWCFGGFGSLLLVGGILCCISWKPLGNPDPASANLSLGVVLIIIFFLQASFNAWQDYSSSRVMDSISTMVPEDTLVIREGVKEEMPTSGLVPGDCIIIKAGNKVPADVRIANASSDLKFDQSILTGESKPIEGLTTAEAPGSNYLEAKCIALQGSYCLTGTAQGIVVATGDNTVFGSIAKLSSAPKPGFTPIQLEIMRFVFFVVAVVLFLIIVVIVVW